MKISFCFVMIIALATFPARASSSNKEPIMIEVDESCSNFIMNEMGDNELLKNNIETYMIGSVSANITMTNIVRWDKDHNDGQVGYSFHNDSKKLSSFMMSTLREYCIHNPKSSTMTFVGYFYEYLLSKNL